MLSPASLRVCCLAVMAPALTKADRQAGCLPVVLSDSFCVPKTSDTYNIKGRINENRIKCAYTCESNHSTPNKRKPFMHRACWRTQKGGTAFICRYRTVGNDLSKSLLYTNRVRTQREARFKTWQSTKATTAYAGKIKLKYTMNKNTSNIRNMGLAKANTSLDMQSVRKMKRFSKENQASGPINVMEDSLNFSDSADSPVQIEPLITDITNSDSDVSPVDNTVPCDSNSGGTSAQSILNAVTDTVSEKAVSEPVLQNDSQPFPSSAGADEIEAMDTSNTPVTLTDLLSSTLENFESSKNSPSTSASTLPCPVIDTGVGAADASGIDSEVTDAQESLEVLKPEVSDSAFEASQQSELVDIPVESDVFPSQPLISKHTPGSIFTMCMNKLPVLNCKNSNSSIKVSSLFSMCNSSKLLTNASRVIPAKSVKCPVIEDNRFGLKHLVPVRQEKSNCCLCSSQELELLESMLADKATVVRSTLASSSRLLLKHLSAHIKNQMSCVVEHYQRKFQIPCQHPAKHVNMKSNKEFDLKAELLQSEDVKNMSTQALVNLVKKLESSGSQSRILTPQTPLSGSIQDCIESTPLTFDPDDCVDIKHTSGILLSALKNVLKSADPYMTDVSSEESESESEEEETESESETTDNTSALWNYLTQRTKLGSRSTWLLARIHELEFRIKEYNERWNEIVKAEGSVCFEEPVSSLNSSLNVECDETSKSVKQTVAKNFFLPLNGFLDRNDATHIVKSTRESLKHELEDERINTESDTEVCCRIRPLNVGAFRKRKIVFMSGLHNTNPKFPRLSTVNCTCNSQNNLAPCILCTGQYHSTQSVDPESMALRDRVSILDSYFHPALSADKDIPFCLHLDNILKTETKYHNVRPPSPEPNTESDILQQGIKPKFSDLRSHRKLSRYARSLSAKYRNKHHRTTKHLRKHKLVFGKWRRLHNKHTLRARNRFRRYSIASSGSSPDSPVHSPMSIFDDGMGFEKKRRDDSQFDIDDVIIPCNSKSGRLVEIQYKEIMIPSWREMEVTEETSEMIDGEEIDENISDSFLTKKFEILEVEEKEKVRRAALGLNKRMRRNRCDSRADSSGANTPDPTSLYNNQDNVFQKPNFNATAGPYSPASPPATPNSAIVSDDSQPPFGNGSTFVRLERKKVNLNLNQKRNTEENASSMQSTIDFDEVPPYERKVFPLTDEQYEEYLLDSNHNSGVYDMPSNTLSYSTSPISSSSSTSTVEEDEDEDDDLTDPEWTVVKPMRNGPEQALVLKFAKR